MSYMTVRKIVIPFQAQQQGHCVWVFGTAHKPPHALHRGVTSPRVHASVFFVWSQKKKEDRVAVLLLRDPVLSYASFLWNERMGSTPLVDPLCSTGGVKRIVYVNVITKCLSPINIKRSKKWSRKAGVDSEVDSDLTDSGFPKKRSQTQNRPTYVVDFNQYLAKSLVLVQ